MRLKELLSRVNRYRIIGRSSIDIEILGLSTNSKEVKRGDLFFALPGSRYHGIVFADEAIKRGAVAIVSNREPHCELTVPVVVVEDIYETVSAMADYFFEHPSKEIKVIGITGTNGKTTTSYLLHHILNFAGRRAGLIGTIEYILGNKRLPSRYTTPEAVLWQSLLRRMVDAGMEFVVSEVSSHSLSLKRVWHTEFLLSIFTNLTRDHLDFHGQISNYYEAKKTLFEKLTKSWAVVNLDDPYGMRLSEELKDKKIEVLSFGFNEKVDFRIVDFFSTIDGSYMGILHKGELIEIRSALIGYVNAYNIAAALTSAIVLGLSPERVAKAIERFIPVKGRLQRIKRAQDFAVFIDYAHTPDALGRVLEALRSITRGRIITVFGCGGDRDRGKRSEMGLVATELSDYVIVTSDNPRSEDPASIALDIVKGAKRNNYVIVLDRQRAIWTAIELARKGDTVLIAGKGHEEYQEFKNIRIPFSDVEVVEKALSSMNEVKLVNY